MPSTQATTILNVAYVPNETVVRRGCAVPVSSTASVSYAPGGSLDLGLCGCANDLPGKQELPIANAAHASAPWIWPLAYCRPFAVVSQPVNVPFVYSRRRQVLDMHRMLSRHVVVKESSTLWRTMRDSILGPMLAAWLTSAISLKSVILASQTVARPRCVSVPVCITQILGLPIGVDMSHTATVSDRCKSRTAYCSAANPCPRAFCRLHLRRRVERIAAPRLRYSGRTARQRLPGFRRPFSCRDH